jgi:hypothetical protein
VPWPRCFGSRQGSVVTSAVLAKAQHLVRVLGLDNFVVHQSHSLMACITSGRGPPLASSQSRPCRSLSLAEAKRPRWSRHHARFLRHSALSRCRSSRWRSEGERLRYRRPRSIG